MLRTDASTQNTMVCSEVKPALWARRGDLRRRLAPAVAEHVVLRLEYLPEHERTILRSVFVDQRAVKDLAPVAGHSAKVLRRVVNRAVRRVLGARFLFVLEHRSQWAPTRRRVATLCFIDGCSVRSTADRLGLSLHAVRRHREAIEALFGEQTPRCDPGAVASPDAKKKDRA